MSAFFADSFYQDGLPIYDLMIWKTCDMESSSDLWKAANSEWKLTVLNSWAAGLPSRLGKEVAGAPLGTQIGLAIDSNCLPRPWCWLPLHSSCTETQRQSQRSWGQFDWRGLERREGEGQKMSKRPDCLVSSWRLGACPEQASSRKYAKLLISLITPTLFYLTWHSHSYSLHWRRLPSPPRASSLKHTRKGKALTYLYLLIQIHLLD